MVQRDGSRTAAAAGDHRLKLYDRWLPWTPLDAQRSARTYSRSIDTSRRGDSLPGPISLRWPHRGHSLCVTSRWRRTGRLSVARNLFVLFSHGLSSLLERRVSLGTRS
jgi:hypothetical protein